MLLEGKAESFAEIAHDENITRRYVAKIIRLAFLSPDIIESILDSKIPPNLTLERLTKGFPHDWQEQRQVLNFR